MTLDGIPAFVFIVTIFGIILAILFSPLFVGVAMASRFKRKSSEYQARTRNTVVAQYDPPRQLSPAEIGYLYDQSLDERELWATFYDLQLRKLVRLEGNKIIANATSQQTNSLKDHEKVILHAKLSKSGRFSQKTRVEFLGKLHNHLQAQGYYKTGYYKSLAYILFPTMFLLSLWPLLTAGLPGTYNGVPYEAWSATAFASTTIFIFMGVLFLWPLYFIAGLYVVGLVMKHAGIFWLGTKKLRALWPELDGYREYLKNTDLKNAQFELQQQDVSIATETLPYIISLNLPVDYRPKK